MSIKQQLFKEESTISKADYLQHSAKFRSQFNSDHKLVSANSVNLLYIIAR